MRIATMVSTQEKDDCTHWCHPSPYTLWIHQLYGVLQQERGRLPAPPAARGSERRGRARQRAQNVT